MSAEIVGGWIAWACIAAVMGFLSVVFVRRFEDRHDREWFPTLTAMISLALVLGAVCLVPVDVFLISSTNDPATGEKEDWATEDTINTLTTTLQVLYYSVYSLMTFFAFVVIPFAYFYFEAADEDITFGKRCMEALKFTMFPVIIFIVIIFLGAFLKVGEADLDDPEWYKNLIGASSLEKIASFIAAFFATLGLLVFLTYTAYGISALPIGWIRGYKNETGEQLDITGDLDANREKQRALNAKYMSGKRLSTSEKKQMEQLEREEKLMQKRSSVLENRSKSWGSRAYNCIRPFLIVFGILYLLFALLVVISLLLTNIDKTIYSTCGSKCGWAIDKATIANPLDLTLMYVSYVFPLDFIIFVAILFAFFAATMSGIVRIGIRLLWVKLYSIRPKATPPQGLLITAMLLMMVLLYLNIFLVSLAPSYATFGYQKYCNITELDNPTPCADNTDQILFCSVEAPEGKCTATAVSMLVNRINVLTPFFGIVFFAGGWIFLVMWLAGLLFSIFRRRPSRAELDSDSEDES